MVSLCIFVVVCVVLWVVERFGKRCYEPKPVVLLITPLCVNLGSYSAGLGLPRLQDDDLYHLLFFVDEVDNVFHDVQQ